MKPDSSAQYIVDRFLDIYQDSLFVSERHAGGFSDQFQYAVASERARRDRDERMENENTTTQRLARELARRYIGLSEEI